MAQRAIAFVVTVLIFIAALYVSFNAKPPEGHYLIDANPGVWPTKAQARANAAPHMLFAPCPLTIQNQPPRISKT